MTSPGRVEEEPAIVESVPREALDLAIERGLAESRQARTPEAAYRLGFIDGLIWGLAQIVDDVDADPAKILTGTYDALAGGDPPTAIETVPTVCARAHPRRPIVCAREPHDDDDHLAYVADVFIHW